MKQSKTVIVAAALVLAALLLTTSGCSLDGEVKEYRDPAKLIEVEVGGEFAIILESNPTTGYQWKLAEELDGEIVALVKTEYEAPETDLLGASGEEKWTFEGVGVGETAITLAYVRPWEQAGPAMTEEEKAEPEEGEAETEEGEAELEEGGEETGGEEVEAEEAEGTPETVTFNVRVRKKGSMDKEPKKYESEDEAIEVVAGYEFALVVESNPTTGYSWRLAEPLDEKVVELVKTEFEGKVAKGGEGEAEGEGQLVGAPGEEIWVFQAVAEGETEIKLEYVRSWETGKAPEDTRTFKVTVKSPEEEAEK